MTRRHLFRGEPRRTPVAEAVGSPAKASLAPFSPDGPFALEIGAAVCDDDQWLSPSCPRPCQRPRTPGSFRRRPAEVRLPMLRLGSLALAPVLLLAGPSLLAQAPTPAELEFFEKQVRPLL